MTNIYVIESKDHTDNEIDVIGVASSPEKALEMCKEYFGDHRELSYRYIGESIEWIRTWEVASYDNSHYECTITLRDFTLDEI
jgi:hypothetical protein